MILETIIAALVPAGVEGLKQLITRFTGGVRATSVEEQIKLDSAEVEKLKALADLDKPIGQPSQWVIDLRASSRYVGALSVIAIGFLSIYVPGIPEAVQQLALEAANITFGFLFGSRIVTNWKSK